MTPYVSIAAIENGGRRMITEARMARVALALDACVAEALTWPWMARYLELRLADPEMAPLAALARAKAETEARAA